jgi:hypothetical protein
MRQQDALSISIGVLGGLSTLLTATVLPLPVWVISEPTTEEQS